MYYGGSEEDWKEISQFSGIDYLAGVTIEYNYTRLEDTNDSSDNDPITPPSSDDSIT